MDEDTSTTITRIEDELGEDGDQNAREVITGAREQKKHHFQAGGSEYDYSWATCEKAQSHAGKVRPGR